MTRIPDRDTPAARRQCVWAFIQGARAAAKVTGIQSFGDDIIELTSVHIDADLPTIIDDGSVYLPDQIRADLVLDLLVHPDLSYDLAALCAARKIPIVASGKKAALPSILAPPT